MTTQQQRKSSQILESIDVSTPTPVQNTVATTLNTNRALQETFQCELRIVNKSMHQNQAKANDLVRQLVQLKSISTSSSRKNDEQSNIRPNGNSTYTRRWTKGFFIDYKGSEPKPNVDTLRRREIEKQSFFYHTQPPWTSKESDELLSIVAQYVKEHHEAHHRQNPSQSGRPAADDIGDADGRVTTDDGLPKSIDFQDIADILNQNYEHSSSSTGRRNSGRTTTQMLMHHRRSAKECQIHYRNEKNRNEKKRLFSDIRERTVLEQSVATMLSTNGASNMDWDKVAEGVSEAINSSSNTDRYTAQDCLLAYHTKLKTPSTQLQTTSSSWTREEDELLLKFIAAAGPQTVIDSKNTLVQSSLCTQILPHKSKKQLFTRVNHSLLNPNMQRNDWSDHEERRLPICMKIYYTPNPQDGFQLYCASTHCNGRSTKSVVDKWNRSINPAYSTKPFTTEEDEALLKVMRSVLGSRSELGDVQSQLQHIGWVELSQTYFPHRHPQRLQNRWSELATDQDIINREKAKLAAENNGIENMSGESKNNRRHQRRQRKRSDMS